MPPGTDAFFFSDAHLGAEPREREAPRERKLHDFLAWLHGRASHLYIVGDLFDFWFEYREAIPRRHFATLAALAALRSSGVEITYLNGNHDFWLGPFLSRELGLVTHRDALAVALQGKRIWLHHGDGLLGGDLGYKVLKRILRSPISVRLYQGIHPDVGFPVANRVSLASRHSRDARKLDGERLWREIALPRFAEGFDAVMVGHLHHAFERREGDRAFFVLGDWIDQFTYVRLHQGELTMESWGA